MNVRKDVSAKTVMTGKTEKRLRRVLLLGSGPLRIGQAGEFDYSGTQAIKALRDEGLETVLVNPNVATVQTTMADVVYFGPLEPTYVRKVIEQERPDSVLLGFGGQSALNCGLALGDAGVFEAFGVSVLGTPLGAIRLCEDRKLFASLLQKMDWPTPRGETITSPAQARAAAAKLGYPVILRAGFSLGGRSSAVVSSETELLPAVGRALSGVPQVLVEEYLSRFKEIEYELLRDRAGNTLAVCNMENVDPMGVHTGDSIVVAPCQTLSDDEHQALRDLARAVVNEIGIVGECNVQFALDPKTGRFAVIEINPRLSRSSALASKATGYPLAYVAAKLQLGHLLPQLRNAVTRVTSAFFEPTLDYLVCKVPRWDFEKFAGADFRIGSEMKSVGEVMAVGRSFGEALQKALRMIDIGADGFDPDFLSHDSLDEVLGRLCPPSALRIFALARALKLGVSVSSLHEQTGIDRFFLDEMAELGILRDTLARQSLASLDAALCRTSKQAGFSDQALAKLWGDDERAVRARRNALGVQPKLRQIDTLAAEYPARTNYLYLTYHADVHDAANVTEPENGGGQTRPSLLLLGSGCYRIGSSVEFDYCCVAAAQTARKAGLAVTLLNCNPETVSTDFDMCDRLVFDEICLETVLDLADIAAACGEPFSGVLLSMGGQTPNKLALPLARAGLPVLGTEATSIDCAEDRARFSALCDALGLVQPRWVQAVDAFETAVETVGGFPVLLRPSYVLSGSAMRVAHDPNELSNGLLRARQAAQAATVVVSKYETDFREADCDAVARDGEVVLYAFCEHIEHAGVHSGDSTMVWPPQTIAHRTLLGMRKAVFALAQALRITGPFNVQFLFRKDVFKVIECNVRASRSMPFVSKATGIDFIAEAMRAILGKAPRTVSPASRSRSTSFVAVKAPMFSFRSLPFADPVPGVEMAATGEVGCFGKNLGEALGLALVSTGFRWPEKAVLLSIGPGRKLPVREARALSHLGLALCATPETAQRLRQRGLFCASVEPVKTAALLQGRGVDLVVSLPDPGRIHDPGGLRRAAVDLEIPLFTNESLFRAVVRMLLQFGPAAGRDLLDALPCLSEVAF